jgi:2-polyprenyl-6-hydroxyphenyl methylase/3-demethylubiquinone-9 3-methyltransferase
MWKAIENASKLVKPGGFFVIAIYNNASSSEFWQRIKRFYNDHLYIQPILGFIYGLYVCLGYMLRRKTLNLYRDRGMHVFYDAIDWIGGYPYEFACFEEVKDFVEKLGFKLIKSPTRLPCGKNGESGLIDILRAKNIGTNEFVFKKF